MSAQAWLHEALLVAAGELSEEARGYALGRGLKKALIEELRIGQWVSPNIESSDPTFAEKNGPRGKSRSGWLTVPYWSPRGKALGVEFRTWDQEQKTVRDYRVGEAKFSPNFIGMAPSVLDKVWRGGDVWLVEGVFDLALAHVVPPRDAVLACGTARLTQPQLEFLLRFLDPAATVHVAYDEDETGRKQLTGYRDDKTGKWYSGVPDRLQKVGVRSRAVRYSGGKDPGEIWERGGKQALAKAFRL